MRCLLPALLTLGPSLLVAQESALLSQSFNLQYNRWQAGQESANGTTQATYEMMLAFPVVTYRLGAVAFTGSVQYNRLSLDGQSDAATGLNRYGMRLNMFPFRPIQVQVDYLHTQAPGLLGIETMRGDQVGVVLAYRNGHNGLGIQDVEVHFRRGITSQASERETWNNWTLKVNQRSESTKAVLEAVQQSFDSSERLPSWRNTHAVLWTETLFNPSWKVLTNWRGEDSQGNRWLDGDATLYGTLGDWASVTTLGARGTRWDGGNSRSMLAGQSLAWSRGAFMASSSATLTRTDSEITQTAPSQTDQGSAAYILGASYGLGPQWRVSANAAVSSTHAPLAPGSGSSTRTVSTYTMSLSRGGELPDLVRHSMYLVSDAAFNRRVRDDYPPGYLPAELADQLVQRRLRQQGQLSFTLDGGRTSAKDEPGRLDFARMSGDLRAGRRLRMMVLADWRLDEGSSQPGMRRTDRALTGNASLLLGSMSSLTATMGTTRTRQDLLPGASPASTTLPQDPSTSETSYRAGGFNTRFGRLPLSFLVTRYQPTLGNVATSHSAHTSFDFHQVSLRLGYERLRQDGRPTNNRLTFSLWRSFDTMALW